MADFSFNTFGVCTNPQIIAVCDAIKIKLAESANGEWVYGYSCLGGEFGISTPCCSHPDINNLTYDEALHSALSRVENYLQHEVAWHGKRHSHQSEIAKNLLARVRQEIANRKQLTLF